MYRKQVLFQMASERTVAQLRDDLYQRLGKMGMRYFDQTPAGSIVSRVTSDTETIKRFWEVFFALAEGVLTVGSTLVAMAYLDKGLEHVSRVRTDDVGYCVRIPTIQHPYLRSDA